MSVDDLKKNFRWFFEPAPRCTYRYAYGRVCDDVLSAHKWRGPNDTRVEPVEPSIFDHRFQRPAGTEGVSSGSDSTA